MSDSLSEQLLDIMKLIDTPHPGAPIDWYDRAKLALLHMPSIIERVEDMEREAELTTHLGLGTTRGVCLPVGEELREAVAKAMRPTAFESSDRSLAYYLKDGRSLAEAIDFAEWCDNATHPLASAKQARIDAENALAVAIPAIEGPLRERIAVLESELRGMIAASEDVLEEWDKAIASEALAVVKP